MKITACLTVLAPDGNTALAPAEQQLDCSRFFIQRDENMSQRRDCLAHSLVCARPYLSFQMPQIAMASARPKPPPNRMYVSISTSSKESCVAGRVRFPHPQAPNTTFGSFQKLTLVGSWWPQ